MPLYIAVNKDTRTQHRVGTQLEHVCVETIRVPQPDGSLQIVHGVAPNEDLIVLSEFDQEPSSTTHRWEPALDNYVAVIPE